MSGPWLIAFAVQWLLILFLLLLVIGILRYLASVKERWDLAVPRISSYELNQTVDNVELISTDERIFHLSEIVGRLNGAILLFVASGCSSCATLMQQVTEILNRPETQLEKTFIIIISGSPKNRQSFLDDYQSLKSDQVVLLNDEKSTALLSQFGILSMPTGLAVDKERRLIDQTFNPHLTNWLYTLVNVKPPVVPVSSEHVAIFTPASYRRN